MATVFRKFSHEEAAFINPEDTTRQDPNFPELCVSTFSENIINKFASIKNVKVIRWLFSANGNIPIYEILYKNTRIAFFLSRVGAPACAAGIEEVIALGTKKLVLFGSCGVLNEEAANGKIIVPTAAIRDEGTSYHYIEAADEILADRKSVDTLIKCLKKCGYPYVKGKTWTSDAIYRETIPAIEERRQEGCLAVEMECASMLAVSQYRQIPFIQFLYGADSLSSEKWEIRDLELYGLTNAEKYMLLAFECGLAL